MSNRDLQRKTARELRLDLEKDLYQAYSDTICRKIVNLDEYSRANTILAYCPINKEVDTSLLLKECISNKKLVLPRTDTHQKSITPCYVNSLYDLKEGAYNILEPNDNCTKVLIQDIDLVIVPIVAFDGKGTRLGYGGGYYDRLLKDMTKCIKIGAAFSIQEFDHIEKEEHDIKLNKIITEKNIFNP